MFFDNWIGQEGCQSRKAVEKVCENFSRLLATMRKEVEE